MDFIIATTKVCECLLDKKNNPFQDNSNFNKLTTLNLSTQYYIYINFITLQTFKNTIQSSVKGTFLIILKFIWLKKLTYIWKALHSNLN